MQERGGNRPVKTGSVLTVVGLAIPFAEIGLVAVGVQISPTMGYVFLGVSGLLILTGVGMLVWAWAGKLWSTTKRLWPLALARTVRQLGIKLGDARNKIEQFEADNKNLRADRESVYGAHLDTKRADAELGREVERLKANPDELERYCQHVAAELSDFDRELRSLPGSEFRAQRDKAKTQEEVDALKAREEEAIRQHTAEMIEQYHKRHKSRLMELYGALAPRWFDEGDRELFENVTDWPDVQDAAERVRTVCRRLTRD